MPFYWDNRTQEKYYIQDENERLIGGSPFANLSLLKKPNIVNTGNNQDDKTFMDRLDEAASHADTVRDQDVVLFIGVTGAGKGTTINLLNHVNLTFEPIYFNELDEDGNQTLRTYHVGVAPGQESGTYADVSAASASHTLYCAAYKSKHDPFTYVDSPGFEGNRGNDVGLIEGISLRMLINRAKSVKLVVCTDYNDLKSARGQGLATAMQRLIDFFPSLKDNRQSVLFLVTKPGEIGEKLAPSQMIEQLKGFETVPVLREYIDFFSSKKELIQVCRPLDITVSTVDGRTEYQWKVNANNRKAIIQCIAELQPIENPKNKFKLPLSHGARALLEGDLSFIAVEGGKYLREYKDIEKNINDLDTQIKSLEDDIEIINKNISDHIKNDKVKDNQISRKGEQLKNKIQEKVDRVAEKDKLNQEKSTVKKHKNALINDKSDYQVYEESDKKADSRNSWNDYISGTINVTKEFEYSGNMPIKKVRLMFNGDKEGKWTHKYGGEGETSYKVKYESAPGYKGKAWVEVFIDKCDTHSSKNGIRGYEDREKEIEEAIGKLDNKIDSINGEIEDLEKEIKELQDPTHADGFTNIQKEETSKLKKQQQIKRSEENIKELTQKKHTAKKQVDDNINYFIFLERIIKNIDDNDLTKNESISQFINIFQEYCNKENIACKKSPMPEFYNMHGNSNSNNNNARYKRK